MIDVEYNRAGLSRMPISIGDEVGGRYNITERIGSGGQGKVWKAYDNSLGRIVALKQVEDRERLKREVSAMAALNHPGICTLYDSGPDYLVMEYVEGEPINGPLQPEEAARFAVKIAEALEVAHDKNIFHRDLKPSNILKTRWGVKILDFGLANEPSRSPADLTASFLTPSGAVLGTVSYMSPEQAQGRPVDGRSDVFSFGTLLYEMLTGHQAFPGESASAAVQAILGRAPVPFEGSVGLQSVVFRCLEKDPIRRFQTMADVQDALQSFISAAEPGSSKACEDWDDIKIQTLLNYARKSIDIVDSYYDEAPLLANRVAKALRNGAQTLNVNVYMLDPACSFGAQRLLERESCEVRAQRTFDEAKAEYHDTFKECCKDLRAKFTQTRDISGSRVDLKIYKYPTMPGMRLIAVDDLHFVVGWFPLNDTNPNYPCFIVSSSSCSAADLKLVERIRQQRDEIRKVRSDA